jgi:hypothetical protein
MHRALAASFQRNDFKKSHHFDFASMATTVAAQTDAFANKATARKTFSQTQIAALQQNLEGGSVPAWVALDRKARVRIRSRVTSSRCSHHRT